MGLQILEASRPSTSEVGSDVRAPIDETHRWVCSCSLPGLMSALTRLQYPSSPFALSLPSIKLAVLPPFEIETVKAFPGFEVSIKYV